MTSTSGARRCLAEVEPASARQERRGASESHCGTSERSVRIVGAPENSSCLEARDRIEARRQSKHEETLSELSSAIGSERG
jgi:hypothetical protein